MKKIYTLLLMFITINVNAGHGFYANGGSFITLTPNLGSSAMYAVSPNSGSTSFQAANLGSSLTSLVLGKVEQNTYENGGDDVLNHGIFYYTIYITGARPASPVYQSYTLNTAIYNNGGTGNENRSNIPNIDLINGLNTNTNYTLEVYYQNNVSYNGGGGGTISPANNGSGTVYNIIELFTATFTTATTLPLNLANLICTVKDEKIEVKWNTLSESNLNKFILLKSTNGVSFNTIAELNPTNSSTGSNYYFTDVNPIKGNNYYRLMARNNSGSSAYSKIVKIVYGQIDNNLAIFPNPAKEGDILNINLSSTFKGTFGLNVYADNGQLLIHQNIEHNGTDKILKVTLPNYLKKGPYRINISNDYEFFKGTFIVQ